METFDQIPEILFDKKMLLKSQRSQNYTTSSNDVFLKSPRGLKQSTNSDNKFIKNNGSIISLKSNSDLQYIDPIEASLNTRFRKGGYVNFVVH